MASTTAAARPIFSYIGNRALPSSKFFTRKLFFPNSSTLHFHRYSHSSSSAATAAVNDSVETPGVNLHHPWPEWILFVDCLNAKGYLSNRSDGIDYKDMNLMRDACLNFANDRFDIFKSLSVQNIQAVVERGCPNIFRKYVDSGKRLRVYLQLDEGDVCNSCLFRGACDRANVILKESEGAARTVDIVRILLAYALDSPVITGGVKSHSREHIEVSARKLLLELIELSEKAPNPEIPKSIAKAPNPEIPKLTAKAPNQKKKSSRSVDYMLSPDVEMNQGDWMCHKCNFMNFSRYLQCQKCLEDGPKKISGAGIKIKKGHWICPDCSFMNFSRNISCLQCKAKGPKRVIADDFEMKKGDWDCPQCRFMNFASNKKCKRCQEERPKKDLSPGEWECPACDFLNYAKNVICRKCDGDRPKEKLETRYEDLLWRKPS